MSDMFAAPLPEIPRISSDGHRRSLWFAVLIIALVFLAAGVLFAYRARTPSPLAPHSNQSAQEFLIHYGVNTSWYSVSGTRASSVDHPSSLPQSSLGIIEAVAPLPSGAYPVLARIPGESGIVFGVASPNGAFIPVEANGTYKEGLVERPDGLIAFSTFIPAKGILSTGPTIASSFGTASTTGAWHVFVTDSSTDKMAVRDIGQGFGPRFLPDGSILALGTAGVVRIDPTTKARSVVIDTPYLPPGAYDVSADLTHVVLANVSHESVEVYALTTKPQLSATHVGSIPASLYPFAFMPNGDLFGLDPKTPQTAHVYSLATPAFPLVSDVLFTNTPAQKI